MKLYAPLANPNFTGAIANGIAFSQDGVVEIPDDALNLKLVLEVFYQYSTTAPVKEPKVKAKETVEVKA